jgi:hypothetical protein
LTAAPDDDDEENKNEKIHFHSKWLRSRVRDSRTRGASLAEAAVVVLDRFMPGGTISKLVGTRKKNPPNM